MTRKEQIEKFKQAFMHTRADGSRYMACSRIGFLVYALVRGRWYRQAERSRRPPHEKGYMTDKVSAMISMVRQWFPSPDPAPVLVPPEEEKTPRKYPWPDLGYADLRTQIEEWLKLTPPDQEEYLKAEIERKIQRAYIKTREKMKYTPEHIQKLRESGYIRKLREKRKKS